MRFVSVVEMFAFHGVKILKFGKMNRLTAFWGWPLIVVLPCIYLLYYFHEWHWINFYKLKNFSRLTFINLFLEIKAFEWKYLEVLRNTKMALVGTASCATWDINYEYSKLIGVKISMMHGDLSKIWVFYI